MPKTRETKGSRKKAAGARRATASARKRSSRAAATNPLLMTIGAVANCPRGGTRCTRSCAKNAPPRCARASRARKGGYTIPLERARKAPFAREAIAVIRRFHKMEPRRARVFELDDGRAEVTERAVAILGPADVTIGLVEGLDGRQVRIKPLEIGNVYRVPASSRSSKAGKQYVHSHREGGGRPPLKAFDPKTGLLMDLGGTYVVDDWIRN